HTSPIRTSSKDESLDHRSSVVDPCRAVRGFVSNFELAEWAAQKRSHTRGRRTDRRARNVILRVPPDSANAWIPRRSEFHLVHIRRPCAASGMASRSARDRYADDGHVCRALHLRLQQWLHGRRQKFRPLFRLSFVFLRCNARARYFAQFASSVYLLGAGWPGVLFAHWVLDRATERCCRRKKSVRYHSHWRPGIFPWLALAVRPQWHASIL